MLALGSLLGGIVAALFGRNTAFALDALTFVFAAYFVWRIVVPQRVATSMQSGGWLDFVDGFRYLRGAPFLLVVALAKAGGSLIWGAINVIEVNFADEIFPLTDFPLAQTLRLEDGGTATLGIIYVVVGLGTGLGPLVLRRILGDAPVRLLLGVGIGLLLMALGIIGLGIAPTLLIFLLMTFVRTIGTGSLWVFSGVMLQLIVPDRYRGRVFAFEFAALTLTQSLSILGAGLAQDRWGWTVRQTTIAFGGFGVAVAALWFIFFLASRQSARLAPMSFIPENSD
jgi:hypothetical protein